MLTIEYPVTMTERGNTEAEAGIADLKAGLSDYVNRVVYRRETIMVTKNGRRVAALVPVEAADLAAAVERGATLEELVPLIAKLRGDAS
jgi:prevent-host-death family protein